jgi:hypothetical protein
MTVKHSDFGDGSDPSAVIRGRCEAASPEPAKEPLHVMAVLVTAIHVFAASRVAKAWMPGTSPRAFGTVCA